MMMKFRLIAMTLLLGAHPAQALDFEAVSNQAMDEYVTVDGYGAAFDLASVGAGVLVIKTKGWHRGPAPLAKTGDDVAKAVARAEVRESFKDFEPEPTRQQARNASKRASKARATFTTPFAQAVVQRGDLERDMAVHPRASEIFDARVQDFRNNKELMGEFRRKAAWNRVGNLGLVYGFLSAMTRATWFIGAHLNNQDPQNIKILSDVAYPVESLALSLYKETTQDAAPSEALRFDFAQ